MDPVERLLELLAANPEFATRLFGDDVPQTFLDYVEQNGDAALRRVRGAPVGDTRVPNRDPRSIPLFDILAERRALRDADAERFGAPPDAAALGTSLREFATRIGVGDNLNERALASRNPVVQGLGLFGDRVADRVQQGVDILMGTGHPGEFADGPVGALGAAAPVARAARDVPLIPDFTQAARAADRAADVSRRPRTRAGIRGVRTAGTPGRGIGSVRELSEAEAIRLAKRGEHLVRGADGQYVGAPRGIDSPQKLAALRRRLDRLAEEGEVGRVWYDRTEQGNLDIAGPRADRTAVLSAGEGLFSAQATPDTNFGFTLRANNQFEAGRPAEKVRTRAQARKFNEARAAGTVPDLGNKTGVFGGHLDPFVDNPITGTNDIWHARAFGYTGGKADDAGEFARGLTAQEHAFMDSETLLSADRLNTKRAARGEAPVWDGRGTQAAIWVRMKGADLATKSGGRKTFDQGLQEAALTYPDYFNKFTANVTREAVPGRGTGHLPDLPDADLATREAFTNSVPFDTQAGNDIISEELGLFSQPTTPATGLFEGETNPARIARPLVDRGEGSRFMNPVTRGMVESGEALRGLLDGQNAGALNQVIADLPAGQSTALFVPRAGPATRAELEALGRALPSHIVVDNGSGVIAFPDPKAKAPPLNSRQLLKGIREGGDIRREVESVFGAGARIERVGVDSSYIPLLEEVGAKQGTGVVTRSVLDRIDTAAEAAPNLPERLSSAPIRTRAGLLAERDDAIAGAFGGVRDDLQRLRRIFASGGLQGVRDALGRGVPLPVIGGLFAGAAGAANVAGGILGAPERKRR